MGLKQLLGTKETDSQALADYVPTRETRRQETTSYPESGFVPGAVATSIYVISF